MADIAVVFHWSYESLSTMRLSELERWHKLAIDRAKLLWGS